MAKKKARSWLSMPEVSVSLKPETARSIYAVVSLIAASLFILASFGGGGYVGQLLFKTLKDQLFGVGYYLLPISLIFLSIGLLRRREGESVAKVRVIGALLLFISGIGILSIAGDLGGAVGTLVAYPFISFFDVTFGMIALVGIALVGTLLSLDTALGIPTLFKSFTLPWKKKLLDENDHMVIKGEYEKEEKPKRDEEQKMKPMPEVRQATPREAFKDEEVVSHVSFAPIDTAYSAPPLTLLERDKGKPEVGDIKANANLIKRTLQNFGITVEMDEVSIGPTVTRYALKPAEGVRLQKILALQNNLELALAAHPVRIEAPIPGKSLVGIEVPNTRKATVGLASLLSDDSFKTDQRPLVVALGRDISGSSHFANIGKMPHLLVAGATGSGKSVAIHAIIASLLYRNGPATLRFIMIDPKRVELTLYNPIPHLLSPVITDPKKAILSLKWAAKEMEKRYNILEEKSVRDIQSYHENIVSKWDGKGDAPDQMPYIMIIIDELADIMQTYPRELEAGVVRLAQMSRAVGIHLILSTQRPSVNILTGVIKANVPARMALQVASQVDSRTILDMAGAEKLLGAGDMLYLSAEMSKPVRLQTAYISENEVKNVVDYIKKNNEAQIDIISLTGQAAESPNALFSGSVEDDDVDNDAFQEAKTIVEQAGKASTSYLQRKMRIGYSKAARIMDLLEERGVIGPADGARPREVLSGVRSTESNEGANDETA